MKKLIPFLTTVFLAVSSMAATWTVHGFRDNWLWVDFHWYDQENSYVYVYEYAFWDYDWDAVNPQYADSGWGRWTDTGNTDIVEYRDVWVFDMPDGAWCSWIDLSGPAPDYSNDLSSSGEEMAVPGEYWIDFGQDSSMRVSTIQPSDFGKWAWDGSVNASWVEPLAKKGHGKGHK